MKNMLFFDMKDMLVVLPLLLASEAGDLCYCVSLILN